jgi:hypothetical protein
VPSFTKQPESYSIDLKLCDVSNYWALPNAYTLSLTNS